MSELIEPDGVLTHRLVGAFFGNEDAKILHGWSGEERIEELYRHEGFYYLYEREREKEHGVLRVITSTEARVWSRDKKKGLL